MSESEPILGVEPKKRIVPKAYRKPKANGSWRLCHKFKCIKPENRLAFLKAHVKVIKVERTPLEISQCRSGFDYSKYRMFPMAASCKCYLCGGRATLRHHVVPLAQGGRNRTNNIVPLCHSCHITVHPHMQPGHKRTRNRWEFGTSKNALSSFRAVASWNSVQPQINGPLVSTQERQDVNLAVVGA